MKVPRHTTPLVYNPKMPPVKRKRTQEEEEDDVDFDYSSLDEQSDSDIDISSALVGKKPRLDRKRPAKGEDEDDEDDDDALQNIIRESIAKRNVKGGTELLKKTKGKTKIVKGEVGGGSFQSMGAFECC